MAEGELDLSAVLSRLMSDKNVTEIIEKLKTNVENQGVTQENTSEPERKNDNQSVSEGTGLSPDIIEKLPEVMSVIAPLMKNGTLKGVKNNSETEKRNRLLAALKPYMNESRCGMIDSIMTLSKLTGIMDIFPGGNK